MKCRALFWLAILLAAEAGAETLKTAGLDMVLLVDRSGSISSADRRIENELIDLTLTMLARSARQVRVHHRLGVVSFGSTVRIDLPLSAVDPPALQAIRSALASTDSRRSLGNTNFPAACNAATAILAAGDGRRRRSILFITDGRSYVPGTQNREIMRRLQRMISTNLPSATTVDVLIVGSERDAVSWRRLSGVQVEVARGRGAALATLHRDVSDLLGTPGERREIGVVDTIELPPYLDLVVFDVIREPTSGSDVSVFAPGARQPLDAHASGVEEVRLGDAVFTLAVHRPAAGSWTFRKANAASRIRVLTQQFFPRGTLVEPDPRSTVRSHSPLAVAYRVVDSDGATLHELPDFPLSVDLTLAGPDARRKTLPMKRLSVPGVYLAAAGACELPGHYWTEVVVSTRAGKRMVPVFEDRWSGFTVISGSAKLPARAPEASHPAGAFALFAVPLLLALWIIGSTRSRRRERRRTEHRGPTPSSGEAAPPASR